MLIALLIPLGSRHHAVMRLSLLARSSPAARRPSGKRSSSARLRNFFDTLGIGSFAPTMAWLKIPQAGAGQTDPPTMLVGHTPPAMTQGVIFLILLGVRSIRAAGRLRPALLLGGLLGAPLVVRRGLVVQLVVAFALFLAAIATS
jgi:hypothetical protein